MPTLELFVAPVRVKGLTADGSIPLDPAPADLPRVLLRRLSCLMRIELPGGVSVVRDAVIDSGAPLTIFPHKIWAADFGWEAGRDYEELSLAGGGSSAMRGRVMGHEYCYRLAVLRTPVELLGKNPSDDRLRLERLVAQLETPAENATTSTGLPSIVFGLWGNAIEGRTLRVRRLSGSDELLAHLDFDS